MSTSAAMTTTTAATSRRRMRACRMNRAPMTTTTSIDAMIDCTTNSGRLFSASSESTNPSPSTTNAPMTSGVSTAASPCVRRVATACIRVLAP